MTTPAPRKPTRLWLVIIAVVFITLLGLFLLTTREVNTTGNTAIWFAGEIKSGALPDAYERLCESEHQRLAIDEFVATQGDNYGVLRDHPGTVFVGDQQYADESTLDRAIDAAWTELEIRGAETTEIWRLRLVREGEGLLSLGSWKVCGIEFVG
jgi:hypothetical protein